MKERTLVYVTGLYALGILAAHRCQWPVPWWLGLGAGALLYWGLAGRRAKRNAGWVLLAAFFCLGAMAYQVKFDRQSELLTSLPLDREVRVSGRIVSEPGVYPHRTIYILQLPHGAKIQLVVRGEDRPDLEPGDRVMAMGLLARPRQARNPGEFDYRAYLWQLGIVAELSTSPEHVTLVEREALYWRSLIYRAKRNFLEAVEAGMSPQAGAIARALLFGDKTALEKDLREMFLTLGIMHLMAVSGLHVGFVLVLARGLQGFFGFRRVVYFHLTLGLLLFYCAATGFAPSVLRASLMAAIVLLGELLRRERDFYTGIAAAAFILLVYNPFYLFHSGFQLSFLSAWGLVYFSPLVRALLPWDRRWREFLVIPLAAQVAVLPVTAYYFNLVSVIGLLTNVVIVPMAGLVVTGGLVAFFVSLFSKAVAGFLLAAAGVFIEGIVFLCTPLKKLPYSAVTVATPSLAVVAMYYLGSSLVREMVVHEAFRAKLRPYGSAVLVGGGLLVGTLFLLAPGGPRPLEIVFLDVGQGDAIVLHTPQGRTVLVDGGGTPAWQRGDFRVGRDVVVPYLEKKGIRSVDLLISTHPDTDHVQGLEDVLQAMAVGTVLIPPKEIFAEGYERLLQLADAKKVPVREVAAGDRLRLGEDLEITVLNPPGRGPVFASAPDNNHSLVLQVRYGSAGIWLTGDIEIEGLQRLLEEENLGACHVFKAPHHGSHTGYYEPFLDAISPVAVVLSVGRNSFGHPSPQVVRYWEERGVAVYRTDEHGAVTVVTDGRTMKIIPFIPGGEKREGAMGRRF